MDCYLKALKVEPGLINAYDNLGWLLARLERFAEAEKILELGLRLSPGNDSLNNNLAALQLQQQRYP